MDKNTAPPPQSAITMPHTLIEIRRSQLIQIKKADRHPQRMV